MRDDDSYDPDPERVQSESIERRHDRTEAVEDALGSVGGLLEEEKYPVTAEELSVEYGDQVVDLPNETESLGSVFDRLVDERFDSVEEVREAVYQEETGRVDGPAGNDHARAPEETNEKQR